MPKYRIAVGGNEIVVSADSPEQAAIQGRLKLAGQIGVRQAEAGAQERSGPPPRAGQLSFMPGQRGAPSSVPVSSEEDLADLDRGKTLGAIAAGASPVGHLAPAGFVTGMAKDAAVYGAAEGAEKLLGLPPWTGEIIGALGPAKSLGKLLLGGAMGGAKKGVATGAATAVTKSAEDVAAKAAEREAAKAAAERIAERKLELEARKVAAREAESAARIRALEETTAARVEAIRNGVRVPRSGPRAVPKPAAAPAQPPVPKPEPEFIADDAVAAIAEPLPFKPRAARPKLIDKSAVSVAPDLPFDQRAIPGDVAQIVQQLQQKMSMRGGKELVRKLLSEMPPDQAAQISALLSRGQAHPATILMKPKAVQLSGELAKLIGQ